VHAELATSMTGHRSLTSVDLSWNPVGCREAAAALATCLTDNIRLTSLSLAGCALRDEGAATVARGLASAPLLTALDLSSNDLSPAAVPALVEVRGLRERPLPHY
jgi:Ran GTPase-activating protein (RanGAP) involved in mRNA processing and transport